MGFEIIIQQYIQQIFGSLLWLFSVITEFGDENAILIFVLVIYFGVDKKFGERLGFICLASGFVNGVLKMIIARPRPYVNEPSLAAESLRTRYANSYSMPSGHAQSSGALYYAIQKRFTSKLVRGLCIAAMVLVPLSRVVLGVHYISDVLVGLALGIALTYAVSWLFDKLGDKITLVYIITAIGIAAVIWFFKDLDRDAIKMMGSLTGFCLGAFFENRYVGMDTNVGVSKRALRVFFALALLVLLRVGLKIIFGMISDSFLLDFLRYAILTFTAIFICPWIFIKARS